MRVMRGVCGRMRERWRACTRVQREHNGQGGVRVAFFLIYDTPPPKTFPTAAGVSCKRAGRYFFYKKVRRAPGTTTLPNRRVGG